MMAAPIAPISTKTPTTIKTIFNTVLPEFNGGGGPY
jgi:hypothetical protein